VSTVAASPAARGVAVKALVMGLSCMGEFDVSDDIPPYWRVPIPVDSTEPAWAGFGSSPTESPLRVRVYVRWHFDTEDGRRVPIYVDERIKIRA